MGKMNTLGENGTGPLVSDGTVVWLTRSRYRACPRVDRTECRTEIPDVWFLFNAGRRTTSDICHASATPADARLQHLAAV